MKKYTILLLVLIGAIAACKKDKNVKVQTIGIVGKWELRISSGGLPPVTYAPGNGTTFQFNADSSFVQYRTSVLFNQGTYSVVKVTYGQITFDELYLNHKLYNGIQLRPDTLIIGSSAADGPQENYVRQY